MEGSIFSTLTSNELGIFFTGLGVALSAILSGIGSAIGVGKAGQAAAGVIADQPERFGNCLVLELLPGSQGIYGFAVSILILIFSGLLGGSTESITFSRLAKRADGFGNGMMLALMVETYALLSLIVSVFLVLFA
ncbi:MAG: hypothetical protein KH409_08800 [Clostridium sp.]|nr:hypothetical protein [Clostridium sp.]